MTSTQLTRTVLKPVVFVAALGPLAWLVYNAFWGDLGVNPVETITNYTGIWTLRSSPSRSRSHRSGGSRG